MYIEKLTKKSNTVIIQKTTFCRKTKRGLLAYCTLPILKAKWLVDQPGKQSDQQKNLIDKLNIRIDKYSDRQTI